MLGSTRKSLWWGLGLELYVVICYFPPTELGFTPFEESLVCDDTIPYHTII